jgi:hypothetical protein
VAEASDRTVNSSNHAAGASNRTDKSSNRAAEPSSRLDNSSNRANKSFIRTDKSSSRGLKPLKSAKNGKNSVFLISEGFGQSSGVQKETVGWKAVCDDDSSLRGWLISGMAARVGNGRRREGFWQGWRALDALGAMVFLATD